MQYGGRCGSLIVVSAAHAEVQEALGALPRAHALLLRGAIAGFSDEELAALLDVPRESVRPMLRLAATKLASLLST